MTDHEPWSAVRERYRLAKESGRMEDLWAARTALARYRMRRVRRMLEEAKRKSA